MTKEMPQGRSLEKRLTSGSGAIVTARAELKERDPARVEHEALVTRLIKVGDVLTHTRCMGIIEEHEFTGWSGKWIAGLPTRDTMRLSELTGRRRDNDVDDIAPANVTHINRVPVDCVEMLADRGGLT